MYVLYNNQLIKSEELPSFLENRSFLYGDSLFETMIYRNGEIQFWEDHLKRLRKGIKVLRFLFSIEEDIKKNIQDLINKNEISSTARIRFQLWRKSGGYFTPTKNEIDFIITVEEYKLNPRVLNQVYFCKNTVIYPSSFSKFKTANSLPYILAAIEKRERRADDLILLDKKRNLVEGTASNLFWVKEDVFYTPSLKTGCVAGIMRKNIIRFLQKENYTIKKGFFSWPTLLEADSAFLCNVTGIYPIQQIENIQLHIHPIGERLNTSFCA